MVDLKVVSMSIRKILSDSVFQCDATHVIQVRKVENDETFDINVKIAALGGSSEYLFERSSTDEIPAGYFKTTVIGVELNQ